MKIIDVFRLKMEWLYIYYPQQWKATSLVETDTDNNPTAFLIVDLWPCRPMKNDLRICNDQPGLRYNTVCCPRSIKTVQWCMAHRHHWTALILGAQQTVLHLLLTINIRIYYHPCNTSPTAIFSQRNEKISRTVSTAPHKCNTYHNSS